MKYINRLYEFMRYRYGVDELYRFLLCVYLCLVVINLFISSSVLSLVEFVLFVIAFYRVFSKNISKRRKENNIYLEIRRKILRPFEQFSRDYCDRDVYVYRKCRFCKTTLKLPLPLKRGIKHIKCPKCKNRITTLILRKQKIEVIRDKRRVRK